MTAWELVSVPENLDHKLKWDQIEFTKERNKKYARNPKLLAFLEPILQMVGTERILDVGCGIGTFGKLVSKLMTRGEVIGIDLSPSLVEYGNRHWARREGIHLEVGDANYIAYPDRSFDVVASFGLVENVSDQDRILSEMLRVCDRPGRLIFIHNDLPNMVDLPLFEPIHELFQGSMEGARRLGVDLDFSRFSSLCKRRNLPIEEFTFTLEYRNEITEKVLKLIDSELGDTLQSKEILTQMHDFYYQYLQVLGWTEEDLWERIHNLVSKKYYVNFLKQHVGEEFYRKEVIKIYRIFNLPKWWSADDFATWQFDLKLRI